MDDKDRLGLLRHSTAHLLAAAVLEIWPNAKLTIGPAIETGFYYDIDFLDLKISESDFAKIEEKMREIVKTWENFQKIEVTPQEALERFKDNEYKLELIREHSDAGEKITLFKSGNFIDLCAGGHIENPKEALSVFKLLSVAGAYWRGNEKNKMLTRIYGTAFFTQEELDSYLNGVEESKKRDHRKIGKEMDLFTFSEYVGSGLPLYTAKGAFIRRTLNEYIEEMQTAMGYEQVWTPQIAKAELFKKSGHYDKYKEDMFKVISNYSDEEFYLKPMNCPQHTQIYASQPRSYRDLPIRMTDFAMLYRDERPGELNGLARVRAFSQDDCHIFCREDQVDFEIDKALQMTKEVMRTLGFSKYRYRLSTRDPNNLGKYLGNKDTWDRVEKWAVEIMKRNNIEYYDGPGEAAFYAPKMDLMATDALGREWQLSTIQIDYVQPERFGLFYTDSDGSKKTPVMIHRAVLGSTERAMMILTEHFAGNFPLWLCPVQVAILSVSEKHIDYAKGISEKLRSKKFRIEQYFTNETLGNKIRKAQTEKIPYVIVVGDKEVSNNSLSVRLRGGQNLGEMSLDSLVERLDERISSRIPEL